MGGAWAGTAPHHHGRRHHDAAEQQQEEVAVDARCHPAAEQRRAGAGEAEQQPGAPAHPAGPPVRQQADGRGDGHEDQRRGRGGLGTLPSAVDERRDGEDGAAAAEGTERQPDDEPERGREESTHWSAAVQAGVPAVIQAVYPPMRSDTSWKPCERSMLEAMAER